MMTFFSFVPPPPPLLIEEFQSLLYDLMKKAITGELETDEVTSFLKELVDALVTQ